MHNAATCALEAITPFVVLPSTGSSGPVRSSLPPGADIILDAMGDAIFACDRRLGVRFRNAVAGQLLDHCPLVQSESGHLSLADPDQARLEEAVCAAIERHVSAMMTIDDPDHGRYVIRIDPTERHYALISVRNVDRFVHRQCDMAADAYGFTAAETGLAVCLLRGRTLEQHALDRNLRISTVRSHLSALLGKTGTQRQGEFISLLMGALPSLAPETPA